MKFKIMHESKGRIRVQALAGHMTLSQADLLEAYLQSLPGVYQAAVHERTRCAVIRYQGSRAGLLEGLGRFSYHAPAVAELMPLHSGRALSRAYQEKLVGMALFKTLRTVFFPSALNTAYTLVMSAPYLVRGLKCLLRGQLRVELLDGLSIGISMARRDFSAAGSVMFLLKPGGLLEEWTHKKSVDDLARCMSLNIDRVWLKTPSGEVLTPLAQVQTGDLIAVRTGGLIPLDGVLEEGEVMVNQASLTGESLPVSKRPGTAVYAGTAVEEGQCVLRVTQQSGESRYDKIVAMIEQSERLKSAAESRAADLADR
ncbi:MAG: heavy metal translocating P-type ATPase, partial [Lawsonibacter sp.]